MIYDAIVGDDVRDILDSRNQAVKMMKSEEMTLGVASVGLASVGIVCMVCN